jgi:hypothetical protein
MIRTKAVDAFYTTSLFLDDNMTEEEVIPVVP